MPITVRCQFCGRVNRIASNGRDDLNNCAGCGARLLVSAPDAERDAPRADSFGDGTTVGEFSLLPGRRFWIGGAVLLVLFGFVGGIVWIVSLALVAPPPQPPPVARRMPPFRQMPRPIVPVNPQPLPQPVPRGPGAQAWNRPPVPRPRPLDDADGPPRTPVPWSVVIDPPQTAATLPLNLDIHIPIPEGPNPEIVFPNAPSTFVSVGNVGHGREQREIWDFQTNRKIGTTHGLRTLSENLGGFFRPVSALSADGRTFMTQGLGPFDLVVWDVAQEKQIRVVSPEHAATAGMSYANFAGRERLVTFGPSAPMQVLGINDPVRKRIQRFPRESEYNGSSLAISPGGSYLAVFHPNTRQFGWLRFYDLESGAPAGQLPLPRFELATPTTCAGVAFSPDGQEVAALFDYRNSSHLVCWDLRAAKLIDQIDFGGNLRAILGAANAYLFAPLEWFPDRKHLLVYGQGIVDRSLGKVVWNIPDEPKRMRYGIRHVAGAETVLSVTQEGQDQFVLNSLRVPWHDIDQVAEVARAAGEKTGKELSPLTVVNVRSFPRIALTDANVAWRVEPDPAPPLKSELLAHPIPVEAFEGSVRDVSIGLDPAGSTKMVIASVADAPQTKPAAAAFATLNAEIARRLVPPSISLQAIDAASGKREQVVRAPFDGKLLDVSADGNLALTVGNESSPRLDVWSMASGKHVVGWDPRQSALVTGMRITRGTMIDATHVITCSNANDLVAWELPRCRALYRIRPVTQFTLSPTRKYFAIAFNRQIRLYDVLTGDCLGTVLAANYPGRAAFHPSGARLAAIVGRDAEHWVVCWNLRDGKVETEFPVPLAEQGVQWCGEYQLLADNGALIDVGRKMVVWRYDLSGTIVLKDAPVGRHWFLQPNSSKDAAARLIAVTLPDKDIAAKIEKQVRQPEMILKPGGKISVDFDSPEAPPASVGLGNLQNDIRKYLGDYYRPFGIDVADGQPVKLQIRWKFTPTGAMVNRWIGTAGPGRQRQMVSIPDVKVETSAAILRDEKTLWKMQILHSSNFGQQVMPSRLQLENYLTQQRWLLVVGTFTRFKPPVHVFAPGADQGLGTSRLAIADAAK